MSRTSTFVAELHCHTEFSMDGVITFDGMVRTAKARGIDVICITDHDTVKGAFGFQRRARECGSDLEFLIGEERTLDDGSHLIGLFLCEGIHSTNRADVIAEIHAQGGLALMPHPFRRKDGLLRNADQRDGTEATHGIDAFELFNAKGSFADNERARSLLD
ncbi:MAG TPA: PHP domain-containing protein, partial [Candidatus Acidoferrum sp.]|nr:PHP domain-containing protein [Candidatus Acidoferrum sp.]